MESRDYNNPPIQEAIFDVRLKFSDNPSIETLEAVWKLVEETFPKKETIQNFQTKLEFNPTDKAPVVNSTSESYGLRLTAQDGSRVVQIKRDGFTFSRLNGYDGWEKFLAEATELLSKYSDACKPEYAERIALRYINSIQIPETTFKIDDYFLTAPQVGSEIPQSILRFFSQVMIKDDGSNTLAIINQTINPPKREGETTFILDIDAFQEGVRIDPASDDFKKSIEQIKKSRTSIFEGSITDKTRNLFK